MGLLSNIGRTAVGVSTGGLSEVYRGVSGSNEDKARDAANAEAAGRAESERAFTQGQATGQQRAEDLYGQSTSQTGTDVQDIVSRRRAMLNKEGPQSTRQRESRNRQIRMAKAAGASPEELAQINRNAASDIANQEYT